MVIYIPSQYTRAILINPLHAKLFRGNNVDMTQVVEILSQVRQELTYSTKSNVMGADALATQAASASTAIIFTLLNRINLVPAR